MCIAGDTGHGLQGIEARRENISAATCTEQLDTSSVALLVTWNTYRHSYIVLVV